MSDPFGRYARREFERRWLLRTLPAALDADRPWSRISDHYIDGTRFRVRERVALAGGEVAWKLTHKFPERVGENDRVVITNNYLTRDEYRRFLRLPGRGLAKRRWLLEAGGERYAVDVFDGALSGLILAEREYETHQQLLAAAQPPFEGVEVTDRVEFTGGALAGKSFNELHGIVRSLLPP